MATSMLYPSPAPLGFELDLPLQPFDPPLPSLPLLEDLFDMSPASFVGDAGPFDEEMHGVNYDFSQIDSAVQSSSMQSQSALPTGRTVAASEVSPSQGRRTLATHQRSYQSTGRIAVDSASGGSRSPGTTSQILTPASTLLDYNASISDNTLFEGDDTDENLSPISDTDYVYVSHSELQPGAGISGPQLSQMSGFSQHPSSSQGSGASDGQQLSRDSSVAPSTTSFSGGQWGAMNVPGGAFIGHQHVQQVPHGNVAYYDPSNYQPSMTAFTSAQQDCGETYVADMEMDTSMFNAPIPYRPGHDQQMMDPQTIYGGSSAFTPSYQRAQFRTFGQQQSQYGPQYGQPQVRHGPSGAVPSQLSIPATSSLLVQAHMNPLTAPPKMEQIRSSPSPVRPPLNMARRSIPTVPSHRGSPYPQPPARLTPTNPAAESQALGPVRPPASGASAARRPLQAAKARPTLSSNAPQPSAAGSSRKGGRQKGGHLTEAGKAKSHRMRATGSCWRCILQRDPCDMGSPCNRCLMRAQKGQPYFFECDRSKLQDLVHDFLPATMTLMHQKQTIEDTVAEQVLHWDKEHPITVYLTSGYGPPLRWSLHEFKPRTNDLLGQFQYLQNPATGRQERYHKYSPPFGLLKLDSADDEYLNKYLDKLLTKEYLWDFGWTCFEEESQVDEEHFQASLVQRMCTLYHDIPERDDQFKKLLGDILRMLIITYIMGHTLTISEDILPTVLDAIKYSAKGQPQPFTSPRLANRQLKFYFAVFRWNIYEKILGAQQRIFHASNKKEGTWLQSFCAMLGFAMVLEEVQRTIIIQADAKAYKNEMPLDQANIEARNACSRIDERWKLMVGLFQAKYRDKKWGDKGSFGPSTPQFDDPVAHDFLIDVRQLLERKRAHLHSRGNVEFGVENQCQYTSRLVARFLLPFLDLPRT